MADQQLIEAARGGDITALRALIRQDPNLLAEMDNKPFVETPLHIAASHGQTRFALEIMVLKPSFAWKLNQDGFTPLHLAIQQGHTKTALRFLNIHDDIVRVKGQGGLTPFLCAVEKGNIELLLRFLFVCPKSIEDVTTQNETSLHLALKRNQLEAFKVLLGWIELGCEESPYWEERFINWKDDEEHTILDLATSTENLLEVVLLLANSPLAKYLHELAVAPPHPSKQISFPGEYTYLLRTDKRLNKAAYEGNTNALYAILREDHYILDRIDGTPFVNTPLHIAASAGQTKLAKEIMKLKPSFAKKLNQDGLSPVHLAVQNQQSETAVELIVMDNELVSIKGKNDMTPLHSAAEVGEDELLAKFLQVSPHSIDDLTIFKESVLHIAVKRQNWNSLKFLWDWNMKRDGTNLLDWTDEEGNNIREIAEHNQNINPKIRKLFKKLQAPPNRHDGTKRILASARKLLRAMVYGRLGLYRYRLKVSDKEREILLVVYTLIATTTYQAVLSPPGGVWQGDTSLLFPDQSSNSSSGNKTISDDNIKSQLSVVGTPVMKEIQWFIFAAFNTLTFAISMSHICYMLPSKHFLFLPLACSVMCYAIALQVISGPGVTALVMPFLMSWWLSILYSRMSNAKFFGLYGWVLMTIIVYVVVYAT